MTNLLKYSVVYCAVFYFLVSCEGGFLSSILQLKRPFYKGIKDKERPTSQLLRLKTSYSDCGSSASIKNLQVSCANKENSDICEIQRGSNVTFNLRFVPTQEAAQLKVVLHGIIDYVPVPLPCPQPDACENSGLTCPIKAGTVYDYKLEAPVKQSYPRMKFWVKGQLEDEQERNVICVKIHVHIV